MKDLNTVTLIGRLTRQPEMRRSNSGVSIMGLSLAVNTSQKVDGRWTDQANFFDCTVLGKMADTLSQYLDKGSQVAITGELQQRRWEKDGQTRSKVSILVNQLQMLGGRQQSNKPATSNGPEQFDSDIPF